jgi:hypothetical protein
MDIILPGKTFGIIKNIPVRMLAVDEFSRQLADTVDEGANMYEMNGGLCQGLF